MNSFLEAVTRAQQAQQDKALDIAELRAMLDAAGAMVPCSSDVQVTEVDAGGVPSFLVTQPPQTSARYVLYLHGGGFLGGSITSHREFVARIAYSADATLLFPHYRLLPEHAFPAALDDAVSAYRWLLEHQAVSPENVSIVGESAGGTLVLATLLTIRNQGLPLPAAAAAMSPWTDLLCTGGSYVDNAHSDPAVKLQFLQNVAQSYALTEDLRNPLISPFYGDFTGLPPIFFQVGSCELLLDDSVQLAEKARRAGVEVTLEVVDEMFHGFQCVYNAPEAIQATERLGSFLKAHSQRAVSATTA